MRTLAGLSFLGLSLLMLVGCSRGRGEPPPGQPTQPAPVETKAAPPPFKTEPEPEPEPAPGELVQLKIPRDGGAWPWSIGVAPAPPDSQPITFKGSGPYAANGFAVRPEAARAVVTMRVDPFANVKKGVDPKSLAGDDPRHALRHCDRFTEDRVGCSRAARSSRSEPRRPLDPGDQSPARTRKECSATLGHGR